MMNKTCDTNNITTPTIPDYMSPFRYMQSNINPLLLRDYHNAFNGIQ